MPKTDEQKTAIRKYKREWHKDNYDRLYALKKERMASDPEYAEKIRQQWVKQNQRRKERGGRANETPEQRERRLQRDRERSAARYREKKRARELIAGPAPKTVKPKPQKKEAPKPPTVNVRKPGRLLALAGWRGF